MTPASITLTACGTIIILSAWICIGLILATVMGYPLLSWQWIAIVLGWLPGAGVVLLVAYVALLLVGSAMRMVFGRG